MIVTSDSTAFSDAVIAANTGKSTVTKSLARGELDAPPSARPMPTNITVGRISAPISPSGSRAKILNSSHESFSSARMSIPDRVAGQAQEDIFETWHDRAKVTNLNS